MLHDVGVHLNVLNLLQEQQRGYIAELGFAHQALSKLYGRLASIEYDLNHRQEKCLSRKEKKKLQWSRAETKLAIGKIVSQQAALHEYLRQCNDLMCSYASQYSSPWTTPVMSTAHEHPTDLYPTCTPGLPWASGEPGAAPQYWDLSMLPERDDELRAQVTDVVNLEVLDAEHVAPDVAGSPGGGHAARYESTERRPPLQDAKTWDSLSSVRDVHRALRGFKFPAAAVDISHAEGGATADGASTSDTPPVSPGHKRRLSENAIHNIEARLASNASARRQCSSHKRGITWTGSSTSTFTTLAPIAAEVEAEGS